MDFFTQFHNQVADAIKQVDVSLLERLASEITKTNQSGNKIILAGNGGSAAIASHIAVDLINSADIKAVSFNEPSLITCFANDHGYENWLSRAVTSQAKKGDLIILISSSGQSPNMINAAVTARKMGLSIAAFTGFDINNKLQSLADFKFWANSYIYNIVESVHGIWLASIVDKITDDARKKLEKNISIPISEIKTPSADKKLKPSGRTVK